MRARRAGARPTGHGANAVATQPAPPRSGAFPNRPAPARAHAPGSAPHRIANMGRAGAASHTPAIRTSGNPGPPGKGARHRPVPSARTDPARPPEAPLRPNQTFTPTPHKKPYVREGASKWNPIAPTSFDPPHRTDHRTKGPGQARRPFSFGPQTPSRPSARSPPEPRLHHRFQFRSSNQR